MSDPSRSLVLLVGDNNATRRAIAAALAGAGFGVAAAATAGEAEELTREHPPDLTVVDTALPGGGLDLCRRLKTRPPTAHAPVLLVSIAAPVPGARVKGLDAGADGYLAGLTDPGEVVAYARALLRVRDAERRERAAEARAAELSSLLAAVVHYSQDAVVCTDPAGTIAAWNPAAERLFGYPAAEVLGRHAVLLAGPDAPSELRDRFARVLGGETVPPYDAVRVRKDGARVHVSVALSAVRDGAGRVAAVAGVYRDIGPRLRAEERARTLLEALPDIIWAAGPDGGMEYVNRRGLEYTGTRPGELAGDRWLDVVHPDDRPHVAAAWARSVAAGDGHVVEFRLRRHDGEYRWHLVRGVPLRDDGGVVYRWLGTAADIDDRRRAGADLREREGLLRAVTEGTPDAVYLKDRAGRYLMMNPAGAACVGKTVADVLGRRDRDLFDAATTARIEADDRLVLETGRTSTYEAPVTAAGVTRVYFTTKSPYLDRDGRVAGVIGVSRDITDRTRAEAALREREGLLRSVIDHIPCGVFWKDRDSRYLGCNAQFLRDHGLSSPDRVVGRADPAPCVTPAEAAFYRDCDRRVMETGEPLLNIEEMQTRPGGVAALLTSKVPLRDGDGAVVGVVGIYQDLTERKALEERFRQAQKMEAVGRLAGGVAHDFNNLLTVINGYADMVLAGLPAGDPFRPPLEEIRRAGDRAADLTRQLLAFGRKQMLRQKVIDLTGFVAELGRMLERVIGEDIELVTRAGPGLTWVRADPGQLGQVLMNLAVNARDAMPTGGRLTIETRAVTLDRGAGAGGEAVAPGPYVVLTVADTGCGIPPDVLPHVFEPFFTTKGVGEGTGLGLATVYGVVKQSDGHVEVESAVGRGTTFRVYLPAAPAPPPDPGRPAAPPPRGTETILIVEDEDGVRGLAELTLTRLGYTVLTAAGGAEAVAAAARAGRPVDLLVCDVVMPGPGGRAVTERLLAGNPGLRVLFMSGHTDDAVVRHGVARDRVHFLQKPFAPSALAAKVREILDAPPDEPVGG